MSPTPTGRLVPTADGVDLVLTRLIRGSVEDVWASVTDSERTARWFGRWEGEPGAGHTIRVQMGFEEGDAWSTARIESCDPPSRLEITTSDEGGSWHLEIRLAERGEHTELTFVQHREDTEGVAEIGPGWEYYLDNLVASREDRPLPSFDDYYPAMKDYFLGESASVTGSQS